MDRLWGWLVGAGAVTILALAALAMLSGRDCADGQCEDERSWSEMR